MKGVDYSVLIQETGFQVLRKLVSNIWEVFITGPSRYPGWAIDVHDAAGLTEATPVQVILSSSMVRSVRLAAPHDDAVPSDWATPCAEALATDLGALQIDVIRGRSGDALCVAADLPALKRMAAELERSGLVPRVFVVMLDRAEADRDAQFYPTVPGVVPDTIKNRLPPFRLVDARAITTLNPPPPGRKAASANPDAAKARAAAAPRKGKAAVETPSPAEAPSKEAAAKPAKAKPAPAADEVPAAAAQVPAAPDQTEAAPAVIDTPAAAAQSDAAPASPAPAEPPPAATAEPGPTDHPEPEPAAAQPTPVAAETAVPPEPKAAPSKAKPAAKSPQIPADNPPDRSSDGPGKSTTTARPSRIALSDPDSAPARIPVRAPSNGRAPSGRASILVSPVGDSVMAMRAFQLVFGHLSGQSDEFPAHYFDRCDKSGKSRLSSLLGTGTDHGSNDDLTMSKREGDLAASLRRYDTRAPELFGGSSIVYLSVPEMSHVHHWADRRNARTIAARLGFPRAKLVLVAESRPEELSQLAARFAELNRTSGFPDVQPIALVFLRSAEPLDRTCETLLSDMRANGIQTVILPYLKSDILHLAETRGISVQRLAGMELDELVDLADISEWEAHSGQVEFREWHADCQSVLKRALDWAN